MPAPQEVIDLVARFVENLAAYSSGAYNETQIRREFIDPFFKTLGWDADNTAGHAESYKDVIHEDRGARALFPDEGCDALRKRSADDGGTLPSSFNQSN